MTQTDVVTIGSETIRTILFLSAPMLVFSLVVGLLISIFQAVKQINEVSLTFIPKILAIFLAIVIFAPWMLETISHFTINIFDHLHEFVR